MSYVTPEQLKVAIPPTFLADAMADGDDAPSLADLIAIVDNDVNGLLSPGVTLPLVPVPQMVSNAALVLACDLIYRRRGIGDEANPWNQRTKDARELLDSIGKGERQLTRAAPTSSFIPASFDTSPVSRF